MDFSHFTEPQRESVKTLDRPLLICAGAGSGKTFTLTQRITWALMPGSAGENKAFLQDIGQALVITYTHKAASEIKERIRANLRSEGMVEQALKVDAAWISTIHGACLRILQEHALELGINPELELLEPAESNDIREQAIQTVLDYIQRSSGPETDEDKIAERHEVDGATGTIDVSRLIQSDDVPAFRDLFSKYTTNTIHDYLTKTMDEASALTDGIDAMQLGPRPIPPHEIARAMIDALQAASDEFSPKNRDLASELVDRLQDFNANPDAGYEQLEQMFHVKHLIKQKGKDLAIEARRLQTQCEAEVALALAQRDERTLIKLAKAIQNVYESLVRANGKIDMSDLIRTTLKAFREHPEIAKSYTDRFKLIMVDEFQDTSQLQIDMISAIANQDRSNLCTVGDSQQSIYRFQGADVSVYLAHKKRMTDLAGRPPQQLDANYRSHADVLSFVRKVCGQPGYFPEKFLDLTAQRDESRVAHSSKAYTSYMPRIEIAISDAKTIGTAYQAEANHIARKFALLHEQGQKASNMVILLGTTTHMDVYQEALRNVGLQSRAVGGSAYYSRPEVQVCQNILGAIANPLDSENLLPVLSSDAIPVSSDDLLHLATKEEDGSHRLIRQDIGYGMFAHVPDAKDSSDLFKHALSVFRRAWRNVGVKRPSQIFNDVILESGWLLRLSKQGTEGQSVAANVLKFVSLLEDAEKQTGYDVVRLTRYMQQTAESSNERLGGLSMTDDDAVRLMTVHASKGLEFPIVAVTSCYESKAPLPSGKTRFEITSKQRNAWMTMMPPAQRIDSFSYVDDAFDEYMEGKTPDQATNLIEFRYATMATNHEDDLAERRRLFYVGATRASEALIICMSRRMTKSMRFKDVQRDIVRAFWPDESIPESSCQLNYHDNVDGRDHEITFTHLVTDSDGNTEGETLPELSIDTAPQSSPDKAGASSAETTSAETTSETESTDMPISLIDQQETQIEIPVLHKRTMPYLVSKHAQTGFFSFSSIAPADMQDEDILRDEVQSDVAHDESDRNDAVGVFGDSSDESIDTADALRDKATDFGTALHACCEWLALQKRMPSQDECVERAGRIGSYYQLHDVDRLRKAFSTWRESDICKTALSFASHQPETPFVVDIDGEFLEGSIDLLCSNTLDDGDIDKTHALIIDYKTGGEASGSMEHLHNKHRLQGECYTYAAMTFGFAEVDVRFVRVEQTDADGEPQVVRFTYSNDEMENLLSDIVRQKDASKAK